MATVNFWSFSLPIFSARSFKQHFSCNIVDKILKILKTDWPTDWLTDWLTDLWNTTVTPKNRKNQNLQPPPLFWAPPDFQLAPPLLEKISQPPLFDRAKIELAPPPFKVSDMSPNHFFNAGPCCLKKDYNQNFKKVYN